MAWNGIDLCVALFVMVVGGGGDGLFSRQGQRGGSMEWNCLFMVVRGCGQWGRRNFKQ